MRSPRFLPLLSLLFLPATAQARTPSKPSNSSSSLKTPARTTPKPSVQKADAPSASKAATSLLTLEHAYDRAAASDQALRIAFLEVQKADLLPLSALTRMAPALRGTITHDRKSSLRTEGTSSGSIVLEQPLLDLSVFPARRRGKLAAESARLARQFTIRETLFGVATAYFEVLKAERQVVVNQQSLQLAEEQESLAQKRADVGEVTRSDVLRARVSVETARRTLITGENALELRRNTLRNVLNLPYDAPLRLAEPLPYKSLVPDFGTLLARAYDQREDLREYTLAVRQAELHRDEVRSQYGPSIVAQGSPTFTHSPSATVPSQRWDAGVSVHIPFFTGGQREIDLANAKTDIQKAALQREQLLKKIEAEVKQAWLEVQTIEGSLAAVRAQVDAAEQGYKDLQTQYSAGTAKSVDVLSALQDLSTARLDLTALTLDYQVALRSLEQVSGSFQESRVRQLCAK